MSYKALNIPQIGRTIYEGCKIKKTGHYKNYILFLELGLLSLNFINFHNMTGKYTLNKYFPTTGRHFSQSEHLPCL